MACQVCGYRTLNYYCPKCGAYIIDYGGITVDENKDKSDNKEIASDNTEKADE